VKEGKNYLVQCNYCIKQFWLGSGVRIRAHLGVETVGGAGKCEKVPEAVTKKSIKAESKKLLHTCDIHAYKGRMASAAEAVWSISNSCVSDPKQPKLATVVGTRASR